MEKVSRLLDERGMIPADLTRLTGIPSGRLSKLAQGQGQLRIPEALRIARALQVSLDFLADDAATNPEPQLSEDDRVILIIARDLGPTEARRRLLRPPGPVFELLEPQAEPSPNPKPGSHRTGTR